jgi:hypothetical protein
MYGAAVFGSYGILKLIHAPEFYDKLLCVPPLNLSVRFLDRASEAVISRLRPLLSWPDWKPRWHPRMANVAWMAVWICLFFTMTGTRFLVKGQDHPGGKPAFWAGLCKQGRSGACQTWVGMLKEDCAADSSSDCLILGEVLNEGRYLKRDFVLAGVSFGRSCDLGSRLGCGALLNFMRHGGLQALLPACDKGDGASCFILGSLFASGQVIPKNASLAFELFQKSCESGWPRGCGRVGVSYLDGEGIEKNASSAISYFEKGCTGGSAASCFDAAKFYHAGKAAWTDILARQRLQRACDLGLQSVCQMASVSTASAFPAPAP